MPRRILSGQKHKAPKTDSSLASIRRITKEENPPISESSRPYRVCTDNNPNNQRQILASNLKDLIKKGNIYPIKRLLQDPQAGSILKLEI